MQSVVGPDSDPQLLVDFDKANLMNVYFIAAMLLHFMRMEPVAITTGLKRKSSKVSPAFQTEPWLTQCHYTECCYAECCGARQ